MKFPEINLEKKPLSFLRSLESSTKFVRRRRTKNVSAFLGAIHFTLAVFLVSGMICFALPLHAKTRVDSVDTSSVAKADTKTTQDTTLSPLTDDDMRDVTGRESLQIDTFTVNRELDVGKNKDDVTGGPGHQDQPSDLQGSWLGSSGLRLGEVGFHDVRIHAFEVFLPSGSVIESEIPSMNGSVSLELLMPNSVGGHSKLGTIYGGGFHPGDNSKIRMELKGDGGGAFGNVLQ